MSQVTNQVFYATTYHPIQAGSIDGTDTTAHDNAVYRALLASSTGLYDPTGDPKAEGDPYRTLFVGRLARHTTEETLKLVMSKFGTVKAVRLVRHIVTGASQGYAFVEFETEKEMLFAYEVAHYNVVDGSQIIVDYNRQRLMPGWIPRRLGGGLGGRKESGQLRFGGRDRPFRAPLRPIPEEQLAKLGIPLPPVGRYMSRFLLPPIPRRPDSSRETHRHRSSRKDFRRGTPHLESKFTDKRVMERVLSQSPEKLGEGGEEPGDGTTLSSGQKKGKHALDLYGGPYDKRVLRYDGEKSHRDRKDYLPEAVDDKDYHERVRRRDTEKSLRDRRIYGSEAAYEKDDHERARGHDGEKSQRYKRNYHSKSADDKGIREQRDSFSETSSDRYDISAGQELPSPGYEGRSKSSNSQEWREGRSLSRESTDHQKRSEEYERITTKRSHERGERKRSRSRERGDHETRRYEENSSESRHRHERREHKRSHSKQRSRET